MSNMNELDVTIKELRYAADAVNRIADSLECMFTSKVLADDAVPGDGIQKPETQPEASEAEKDEPDTKREITLTEMRMVLAEKAKAGFTTMIKELLRKHGAEKLSDIDASEYGVLMAEAEALGNG